MGKKKIIITIAIILILISGLVGGSIIYLKKNNNKTENEEEIEQKVAKLNQEITARVEEIANNGEWIEATGGNVNGLGYAKYSSNGVPIPNGFTYQIIEDEIIIKDEDSNTYVWVPCTLEEISNTTNTEGASEILCQELENSLYNYKGFYVGIEFLKDSEGYFYNADYTTAYLYCSKEYNPINSVACHIGYEKQYSIIQKKLTNKTTLGNMLYKSSEGIDEITQAITSNGYYVMREVLRDSNNRGNMGYVRPFLYIRTYHNTTVDYSGATLITLTDKQVKTQESNDSNDELYPFSQQSAYEKNYSSEDAEKDETNVILTSEDWKYFVGNNTSGFVIMPQTDQNALGYIAESYEDRVKNVENFMYYSISKIVEQNPNARIWMGVPMLNPKNQRS